MIDVRRVLTLLACCCICLTIATTVSADFVGVVVENKVDADTANLCGAAAGDFVTTPLTVCNVSVQFSDDGVAPDRLLSLGFADIQALNGDADAVFYQHPLAEDFPYNCAFLPIFPDFICDSYVAISEKCAGVGDTVVDPDFDDFAFNNTGGIFGGWLNFDPFNGLGDAFNETNPDGKILILQTSVALGLSVEGSLTVFWHNIGNPLVFEEVVDIVCEAKCTPEDDPPCSDNDNCTENDECIGGICVGTPIDCAFLDDACNEGVCNPDSGACEQVPTNEGGGCDDGDPCTPDSACSGGACTGDPECVVDADCNDNNACTDDACLATGCCENTDVNCDDKNPCTTDDCDEVDGCSNIPDCTSDAECDDGLLCTIDTCEADCCVNTPVECLPGDACNPDNGKCEEIPCQDDSDCNDDNDCTADTCEAGVGCVFTPQVGQPCGDPADSDCDGADTCDDTGACNANIADAGTPCSGNGVDPCSDEDTCDGAGTCDDNDADDGDPCEDGLNCTENDTCSGGSCSGDDPCPEELTCLETPKGFECVAFTPGHLDIIPGKCPNRLRRNGLGFIKISLVSDDLVDACSVDASTCVLFRADGVGGTASPVSNPAPRCRDRATPYLGELCGCHSLRKDGIDDLDMKFKVADVVNNLLLNLEAAEDPFELVLECQTEDAPIRASDCVVIGRDLGPNP